MRVCFSLKSISKMCRYLYFLKCTILLLIVNCSCAADLDELSKKDLLKLETAELGTTENYCNSHIGEQQSQLSVDCQKQLRKAEAKLRINEAQLTLLGDKLASCLVDQQDHAQSQSEIELREQVSDLSLQLKLKAQQTLELQTLNVEYMRNLSAAQAELKAYDEQFEEFLPSSCLPFGSTTGIYRIKLSGMDTFYVPCDARLAGSGWLVIQRRMDGSVSFFRNWSDYRAGFGALNGEFFLGLEKLHRLTAQQPYELYVHLEDFEGALRYARYDNFSIGSEQTSYELSSLGRYNGNAGNSMGLNVLQKFSTRDNDNDSWPEGSCARRYHSAWWYASCAAFCNPNGKYFKRPQLGASRGKGIIWQHWHGFDESLKFVQLMIRPISKDN